MVSCQSGVFLAALSSLFFSLCSLIVKFLGDLNPLQLSCFSFFGILVISSVSVALQKEKFIPREHRKLLICRSIIGTIFILCSFRSVQLIPLGDASVLFYTAPAFTVILANWLLKEPCTPLNFVITTVLMICVILVMKPSFMFNRAELSTEYINGVLLAITASFCDALGNVILRKLKLVHFSVILFNYGWMSFVQTMILSFLFSKWTYFSFYQLSLLIILVILNFSEQMLMALALSVELAGPVAMIQASDIVYGYAFQVAFFKESIDTCSIIGGAMITLLLLYSSLLKKRKEKRDILV